MFAFEVPQRLAHAAASGGVHHGRLLAGIVADDDAVIADQIAGQFDIVPEGRVIVRTVDEDQLERCFGREPLLGFGVMGRMGWDFDLLADAGLPGVDRRGLLVMLNRRRRVRLQSCLQLLAQAGYDPHTYDNPSRGHASLVQFGDLITGDLHDRACLREAIAAVKPVACLHFAAHAYVGESVRQPEIYYRNNVGGTLALLEELVEAGAPPVVFSSTCAVYGYVDTVPIAEDAAKRPISPYGRSKLIVEDMLRDFDRAYGLRSVSLRYFNAAGADPKGMLGECTIRSRI